MFMLMLKSHLKDSASEIHVTKQNLKKYQQDNKGCGGGLQEKLLLLSKGFRHKHIAYCLLRGTPYESIEKPRKGNEPDMAFIKEIQRAYTTDVCAGTPGS